MSPSGALTWGLASHARSRDLSGASPRNSLSGVAAHQLNLGFFNFQINISISTTTNVLRAQKNNSHLPHHPIPLPLPPWICSPASASLGPEEASTSAGTTSQPRATAKTTSDTVSRPPSDDGRRAAISTGTPKPMTNRERTMRLARRRRNVARGSAKRSYERSRRQRKMPWLQL